MILFLAAIAMLLIAACIPNRPTPVRIVTPPGWYPDPWNPGGSRWYSGLGWTHHTYTG